MKLTQEQQEKLLQKIRIGKCPNCGCTEDKVISPHVYNYYHWRRIIMVIL